MRALHPSSVRSALSFFVPLFYFISISGPRWVYTPCSCLDARDFFGTGTEQRDDSDVTDL